MERAQTLVWWLTTKALPFWLDLVGQAPDGFVSLPVTSYQNTLLCFQSAPPTGLWPSRAISVLEDLRASMWSHQPLVNGFARTTVAHQARATTVLRRAGIPLTFHPTEWARIGSDLHTCASLVSETLHDCLVTIYTTDGYAEALWNPCIMPGHSVSRVIEGRVSMTHALLRNL
jgi:hypothetical protein